MLDNCFASTARDNDISLGNKEVKNAKIKIKLMKGGAIGMVK